MDWFLYDNSLHHERVNQFLSGYQSSPLEESESLPKMFCPARWVENVEVSERVILVCDSISTLVKHLMQLPKNKQLAKHKLHDTLATHVNDQLITPNILFVKYIANLPNDLLILFKTSKPKIPFFRVNLDTIWWKFMAMFVMQKKIKCASLSLPASTYICY